MATTVDELTEYGQSWGKDAADKRGRENPYEISSDHLPFSGLQVEKFIKTRLQNLDTKKFGHVEFDGQSLKFYDEQSGTVIESIQLGSTIYTITAQCNLPDSFVCLTDEATKIVTVTPSTSESSIGGTPQPYPEGYTWNMLVDQGTGYVLKKSGSCSPGNSFSCDIKEYLKLGINRIMFAITGQQSGATRSKILTCTYTSLSLTVDHSWQNAWKQGASYSVEGIRFSGNMAKVLHVRLDNDETKHYTVNFTARDSYISTSYSYDLTNHFPGSTGVHKIEVWMTAPSVETSHYVYNVMTVKTADINSAKLICLNNLAEALINGETQNLFQFAVYGGNTATLNVMAGTHTVANQTLANLQAEVKQTFTVECDVETEELSLSTVITATINQFVQTATIGWDNSNSFPAIAGATFLMKSSLRSNGDSYGDNFVNTAVTPAVSLPATFTGFSKVDDGWGHDSALLIPAGATLTVPSFQPLTSCNSDMTLELQIRASGVADFDTPILTIMDTQTYQPGASGTNGLIVWPTKIQVLTPSQRSQTAQNVSFKEGEIVHLTVVFHYNYSRTQYNCCRIYVNGVPMVTFEIGGLSPISGALKIGQAHADLYLYAIRMYSSALDDAAVWNNFLNRLRATGSARKARNLKNEVMVNGLPDYELCVANKLNLMVIETPGDVHIPDYYHPADVGGCTWHFQFGLNPGWNFRRENATIVGQGTTSMGYGVWNLRDKGKDSHVVYANGTSEVKGAGGWFDGYNNHPRVIDICAKANTASSMQGHKMGSVNMYTDLAVKMELTDKRLSTWQYPFIGFQKMADGSYNFIGLYTAGPSKYDKATFDLTSSYPNYIVLEGPDHLPLATRFIHPWVNVSLQHNADGDTFINFDGVNSWEVAKCAKESDAEILTLVNNGFKPLYDLLCFCSPFLLKLGETGCAYESLAALNADLDNFLAGETYGRSNKMLTIYDSSYNLIYYSNSQSKYVILANHNVKTYVSGYLTGAVDPANPTTAELIEARRLKVRDLLDDYMDIDKALYEQVWKEFVAAKDNDAKNTYWVLKTPIADNGRWSFFNDDDDSIFLTDNKGAETVGYDCERGDKNATGDDVFQGSNSVFSEIFERWFATERQQMAWSMFNGMKSLAAQHQISQSTDHETIMSLMQHYYHNNSALYFPELVYGSDAYYKYLRMWLEHHGTTYNEADPLTQQLGTRIEEEKNWLERRIIYIMSKYEYGGFNGNGDDGLGKLTFTPKTQSGTYNITVTPAISMYPSASIGQSGNVATGRVLKSSQTPYRVLTVGSDGNTNVYIKALDWISSLGDLSDMELGTRSGTTDLPFALSGKRLKTVILGNATAANVKFNATRLNLATASGESLESLEELDCRNIKTLAGELHLEALPRLRNARFAGTCLTHVYIKPGSRITELSLPNGAEPAAGQSRTYTLQALYLNKLPYLTNTGLTLPDNLTTIKSMYLRDLHSSLGAYGVFKTMMTAVGNSLHHLTVDFGTCVGLDDEDLFYALLTPYSAQTGQGYGRVIYNEELDTYTLSNEKPLLRGHVNLSTGTQSKIAAINTYFDGGEGHDFWLTVAAYGYVFTDTVFHTIMTAAHGKTVEQGFSPAELAAITDLPTTLKNHTDVVNLSDLWKLTALLLPTKDVHSNSRFYGCTGITQLKLPAALPKIGSNTFLGLTGLTSLDLSLCTALSTIEAAAFVNCVFSGTINLSGCTGLQTIATGAFSGCTFTGTLDLTPCTALTSANVTGLSNPTIQMIGSSTITSMTI